MLLQQRKHGKSVQVRHVHIVTDSSYVGGLKASPDLLSGPNGALWQVFKQFTAQGILIHWHWIRRESVELNQFADQLSKAARLNLKDKDLPHTAEAAMCKWWGPKLSYDAIHACLLMFGHGGYDRGLMEQRLRDVLGFQIGDGTSQIMKSIVARTRAGRKAVGI